MITYTNEFTNPYPYDLEKLGSAESLLFFDIETTGLSSDRDMVYLIGCAYTREGRWYSRQWFADSAGAERELLVHFFLFASRFSILVHYNGDTFDLPFLKARAARHGTPLPASRPESLDLYRKLRPLKKLFALPDCRQKTLEALLETGREDPYDGGQLIRFYWEYLRTRDTALLDALLLHNREDIEGLAALPVLLSYGDFFRGSVQPVSCCQREYRAQDGSPAWEAIVSCRGSARIPVPCSFTAGDCRFSCREDSLTFRIPLFRGSLLYFFKNPSDYYYLPEEGRAIHKSVAAYVDKAHRKKATASTCFQPHEGVFFPVPKGFSQGRPVFYTQYKKQPPYLEYKEELWQDPIFLQNFLLAVLPE